MIWLLAQGRTCAEVAGLTSFAPAEPRNTQSPDMGAAPPAGSNVPLSPLDGGTNATSASATGFYSIYIRGDVNAAAIDFAKQILVLIGTLVTVVSASYFGAKSMSDALPKMMREADVRQKQLDEK